MIKDIIIESIKYARGQMGYTLVTEDWGEKGRKRACALGCCLVRNGDDLSGGVYDMEDRVAELLGVDRNWIDEFITAFDNGSVPADPEFVTEAAEIGYEIRQEFLPLSEDIESI